MKKAIKKHVIVARDKKTGKQRIFIFEGELFGHFLLVEEKTQLIK